MSITNPYEDHTPEQIEALINEYYIPALKLIVEKKRAYTTLLQLELKIGCGRAIAIMDKLAADGFIRIPRGDGKDIGEVYLDKIKASGLLKG